MALPTLTSVTYDAAAGTLTLNGSNLTAIGFDPTKLTITGQGGSIKGYSLNYGSAVTVSPDRTSATIALGASL